MVERTHPQFKATVNKKELIKDIIYPISRVGELLWFKVSNDMIELWINDPALIQMYVVHIPAGIFSEWDVTVEGDCVIPQPENFVRLFKSLPANKPVTIHNDPIAQLVEPTKPSITLACDGNEYTVFTEQLSNKIIDHMPRLESTASCTISMEELALALKHASQVDSAIQIIAEDDQLTVQAQTDVARARRVFNVSEEFKVPTRCYYNVEYLQKFVGALSSTKEVKLEFAEKAPLRITFNDGMAQYMLAPRVV